MPGFDESAALLDPVGVHLFEEVVAEKNHRDQDQACHECEAGEVVQVLCRLRYVRKRFRADQRQKQNLAEGDIQAGQTENDKGYRRQPMRETLKRLEAEDFLSAAPCCNPQASHDEIGGAENHDHAEDHDRAGPMQQYLVEIIPRSSCRLDQHRRLGIGNIDPSFDAGNLLEQRLLIDDARRWIGRAIGT